MDPIYNSSVATQNINSNSQAASQPQIEKQFTRFSDLPKEIRCIIWELALFTSLPRPRIVEINQRRLRKTIKDWEDENGTRWRVGLGLPEEDDIGLLVNRSNEIEASEFIETSDDDDDDGRARAVMERKERIVDSQMEYRKLNCLVGIESACPTPEIPKVLLASQESYTVALKHYTRAFSCLGSIAQTWFNFDEDTLLIHAADFILDPFPHSFFEISHHLLGIFPILDIENVRRVKNLAIQFGECEKEWHLEENMAYIMHIFKGLTNFTVLLPHYSNQYRDPAYPRMTELISTDDAKDHYYYYYPHLEPDSGEEDTHVDSEDEPIESLEEFIGDFVQERVMLDEPAISLELIDDWRTALMSGCVPPPRPRIEFRILNG